MLRILLSSLVLFTTCYSLIMSKSVMTLVERKRASMLGLYIADAVAMPVHWMYDLRQLKADYGTITGYVQPKDKFQGCIMNLSNTGGGGRGVRTERGMRVCVCECVRVRGEGEEGERGR